MTTMDPPVRSSFRIEAINIPETLVDASLPVEVFFPDDRREWAEVELRDGSVTVVNVEQPGRYDLRAELPSGRTVRCSVEVLEAAREPVTARLDLRNQMSGQEGEPVGMLTASKRVPRHLVASYMFVAPGSIADGISEPVARVVTPNVRGCLFDRWAVAPPEAAGNLDVVVRFAAAAFDLPLGRDVAFSEPHPGYVSDQRQARPMLLVIRDMVQGDRETLVIVPPTAARPRVTLLLDPDRNGDPASPQLLAYVESVRPAADALFTYVRTGALDAARHAQTALKTQAEELLYGKEASPVCAMVGAYALYRLGDRDRLAWVRNLADWFPHMPDGAIVYGAHMLHEGRWDDAWKYFKLAVDRGIPMYSTGLKLLCDGLVLLRHALPDPAIAAYSDRVYSLAALANMESELTSLRLGGSLRLQSAE